MLDYTNMKVTASMDVTVKSPGGRLEGLDLARALALLGMVIVNFEVAMGASGRGPDWLVSLTEGLQGRAAATFVVLAGVGASLGSARIRSGGDSAARGAARRVLLKRAVFLLLIGTAFLTVWPADILHFYGVWLALGALALFVTDARLLLLAALATLGGTLFLLLGDFFANWNLQDFSYRGLATPGGFLRNLFFDGWHPVLPWVAFYFYGMWLGRQDLRERSLRRRLVLVSVVLGAFVKWLEHAYAIPLEQVEDARVLLLTSPVPPTPAFILFGSCVATLAIVAGCVLAEALPARVLKPMVHTGQLALTLYVAHVLVGLGGLEAAGRLEHQELGFSVGAACAFFAASVLVATLWARKFQRGPLEALMRRFS